VLTNFMNWAMPFVRYRTGDRATIRRGTCACGFAGVTAVEMYGREAVSFTTLSSRVDPRILDSPMFKLPIRDFRVIQEGRARFKVKWVPASSAVDNSKIERMIESIVRDALGDVRIGFERVERLTCPGQKVSRYVSLHC